LSITLHDGKRIRVYISRKLYGKPAIQEYFSLHNMTDKQRIDQWAKAEARHDELLAEWDNGLGDKPWASGRNTVSLNGNSFTIKNIYLGLESNIKSHPEWGKSNNYYFFDTYPPSVCVQIYINTANKRRYRVGKTFSFRSNRQFKQAFLDAIDFLLEQKPELVQYREDMLEAVPEFSAIKDKLHDRFLNLYGDKPW